MESSFRPSLEEVNYFVLSAVVLGAAFTAYTGELTLRNGAVYSSLATVPLLLRELGQRIVAQWMSAYTELEMSLSGSVTTIVGAMFAVLTGLPILFTFPVESEFSGKKYEHWGKTIDALWMKRQYWLVSGGLVALFAGWIATFALGFTQVAEVIILFTFFQLMPFDYHRIPTGELDGAYILRWDGFVWLTMIGLAVLGIGLTV